MAGTIGLTPAGIALNNSILDLDRDKQIAIYTFIGKFTKTCRNIHKSNLSIQTKREILQLYRTKHLNEMKQFNFLPVESLMINYIKTLTKINFIPNTKTQLSL